MKKALMLRFAIIIAVVITVCTFSATVLISNVEQDSRENEMITQLGLICEIYNDEENHDYALAEKLSEIIHGARVSFIDSSGKVTVDTYIEGEPQDDHSTREEVKKAQENGSAVSVRYSRTLGKNQMYAAMKADNGDIIRISYNVNGFFDFASMFVIPILAAAAISIIIGIILTRSAVKQIMKPLNSVADAMEGMKNADGSFNENFEEIPSHRFIELDDFIAIFNYMRESILDNIKSLEIEREKERFILESLNDGVLLFDEDLYVLSSNKAGLELLSAPNLNRQLTVPEIVRNTNVIDSAQKTVKHGKETSLDLSVNGKILMIQIFPVGDAGGFQQNSGLMVVRDITEKRMSEQLKQDFFANAGHELKTPLTAITGFAELLENGLVPKDKKDYYIGKILAEAKRMSTIISDILEISALENKSSAEEITDCSVMEICRQVCESMEPAADAKRVAVSCAGDDFIVKASRKHIYELVENIVSNAVKYNKEGGKVDIELCNVGEIGCIYVRDTGIGIPKESLNRVFERFYRVDKGRSTKEGSTGLGLAIVKHIVNCCGGTVTLDSEVDKGTVVCVRLPVSSARND